MKFRNTFSKGLEQDISKQYYPNDKVYDSIDWRAITDKGLSSGALENIQGNINAATIRGHAILYQQITITSDVKIIGSCLVRDENIAFCVDEILGIDYIVKLFYFNPTTYRAKVIWYSNANTGRLNFSTTYPIYDTVSRYENQNVKKVYFTDNNSNLRWLNIKVLEDDIDSPAHPNISSYIATNFDILPISNMPQPKFIEMVSGGSLDAGMIQYYYQLYNPNGNISTLSPGTGLIHIVTDDEQIMTTYGNAGYQGEVQGTNTGKSVKFSVTGITNFTRIRLISVLYETITASPTINIIYEGLLNGGNITYIDDGTVVLGTYTVEEFNALNTNSFVCKTLTTKANYLFAGDIREELLHTQQIQDYDARVYRYNNAGSAKVYQGSYTGDFYTIDALGNWSYSTGDSGIGYLLPDDADCICPYNDVSNDENLVSPIGTDRYIYCSNGTTIGATGKNITIKAKIKHLLLRENEPNREYWYVKPVNTVETLNGMTYNNTSYPDYSSPLIQELFVGYQRGETMRFATRFIDSKGRKSFPKWICDFRMPFNGDNTDFLTSYNSSDFRLSDYNGAADFRISGNVLYLEMTFDSNTIPDDPYDSTKKCVVEIMRVRRDSNDRTMLCNGVLNIYNKTDGSYIDYVHNSPTYGDIFTVPLYNDTIQPSLELRSYGAAYLNSSFPKIPLYNFFSPEISYFNNINIQTGDKIQMMEMKKSRDSDDISLPYISLGSWTGNTWRYFNSLIHRPWDNPIDTSVDFNNQSRDIEDSIYIQEAGISPQDYTNYALSPYSFRNGQTFGGAGGWSHTGSSITIKLDSMIKDTDLGHGDPGINLFYGICVTSIKRNLSAQYGGNTYNARANNIYISTGMMIDPNLYGSTIDVFGGDTYICGWGFFNTMYKMDSGSSPFGGFASKNWIVIESSINLTLEQSNNNVRHTPLSISNSIYTQEKSGVYDIGTSGPITQLDDYFIYNSVYSREQDIITTIAEPIDITQGLRNDVMIKASQHKFNGELFDSWLDFRVNDYIEIDTQYEGLTKIIVYQDKLFAIQPKGVSVVEVNTRTIINDTTGQPVAVGTGQMLSRYDYVSQIFGSRHQPSVQIGIRGLYIYDEYNNAIIALTNEQGISKISDIQGIQSFLVYNTPSAIRDSDNPFVVDGGTVLSCRDQRYDEILFTFISNKTDDDENFTLAYNEKIGAFCGRYSFIPDIYIPGNGEYFSMKQYGANAGTNSGLLFRHNDILATRGVFYNELPSTLELSILVNPLQGQIGTFNNLTWFTEVTDINGVNQNITLDSYQAINDYQNTGLITLVDTDNMIPGAMVRIMRQWKTYIERDVSLDDPRMRDSYVLITFYFLNRSNYRIVLHDLITSVTPTSS